MCTEKIGIPLIRRFQSLELVVGPNRKGKTKIKERKEDIFGEGEILRFLKNISVKLNKTHFLTPVPLLMIGNPISNTYPVCDLR